MLIAVLASGGGLSDSLHNFSDTISLIVRYLAIRIGERERNEKYTFGYKRAEILVAFINSAVLVGVRSSSLWKLTGASETPSL